MKTEFKATLNLVMENSFGILDKEDKIEVKVILGIREREVFPYCDKEESNTGWFEVYDIKTGGEKWHVGLRSNADSTYPPLGSDYTSFDVLDVPENRTGGI